MTRQAERLPSDTAGLTRAATLLREGRIVAFPTETVYGLGADATNGQAVARIYEAKGRPAFNPLIVHVADAADALSLADLPDPLRRLADAFWPGPLTLVAPARQPSPIAALVTAGLDTVAIRVPEHPLARALLTGFGGPVAAPSANPSGQISPTTADHVLAGLGDKIDAVLDGGPCPVGLESTIIGMDGGAPVLLRPGGLPAEAIATCLGAPIAPVQTTRVTAPGQLASHYAPNARLRLNADTPAETEAFLAFGAAQNHPHMRNLSPTGDLRETAANLFNFLHQLDDITQKNTLTGIACAPIPTHGLGAAINDRLARAAAPR